MEMPKDTEVITFLKEKGFFFFSWLRENLNQFPYCCWAASDILSSYLQEKFHTSTLVMGEWCDGRGGNRGHLWVEIEGKIIDFTHLQFLFPMIPEWREIVYPFTNEELYAKVEGKLTNGFLVEVKEMISQYRKGTFKEMPSTTFQLIAQKSLNFEDYLKRLETSIELKRFNPILEKKKLRISP